MFVLAKAIEERMTQKYTPWMTYIWRDFRKVVKRREMILPTAAAMAVDGRAIRNEKKSCIELSGHLFMQANSFSFQALATKGIVVHVPFVHLVTSYSSICSHSSAHMFNGPHNTKYLPQQQLDSVQGKR